ncbi:PLP-dependent cysteine synthase family protein [Nocardiopsis alba]|uniref:PLP-dependent cysteine synthase family protein n=1 Tax=Nocardiopsis alba TaxID=53437 RepID=UPI003665398B
MRTNIAPTPVPAPSPAEFLAAPATTMRRTPAGAVGNTPVLWVGEPYCGPRRGFWAKLEGHNPGGIKDRPALHMIERARESGRLAPGGRIVESTSGTLGLGLALAGITFGHPVTVVTDTGMEPLMVRLLRAHGAEVDIVDTPHPRGGWQQARRERVRALLDADPTAYSPDQYNNPHNVEAYRGLAHELIAQLGRVDTLVASVGTGGHSAGVGRELRRFLPHLRVVGVDAVGSGIFGQPSGKRIMRGLGSSIVPGNVDHGLFDEVHWVDPARAVRTARTLAATHYCSGGWSVGAVATVARWLAHTRPITERVVAIFPDGPQRYFDTVYNDDYCRAHGLLEAPATEEPEEISTPSERVVTAWTRCAKVGETAECRTDTVERGGR